MRHNLILFAHYRFEILLNPISWYNNVLNKGGLQMKYINSIFTGHKQQKIMFKYSGYYKLCVKIKSIIIVELEDIYNKVVRNLGLGSSRMEVDISAVEVTDKLKKQDSYKG